jgi:tRNA (guanine-N7-)-methyltransferase
MTQRTIEITSPTFVAASELATVAAPGDLFAVSRPLALEIGCGIGDFILQLARQHPHINYLAIDIYNKGCLKTCSKIDAAGLDNVRVVRAEARDLLGRHFGPESLTAIYINCPDPWPKKRHRDRRLVGADFLRSVLYYLAPEGDLYFITDFTDYAEDVAALLPTVPGYVNALTLPSATELSGYPISKYMRRFLDLGQPIHYIHYRKAPGFAAGADLLPPLRPGFRVHGERAGNE